MKLTVFTDYRYTRSKGQVWTERAFVLFLNELARHHELAVVGREGSTEQVAARYALAPEISFHRLPFYESLARPAVALQTLPNAVSCFSRASAGSDAAWLLGPNPHALAFVVAAKARGLPVALGVRSDLPAAVASRYAGRIEFQAAAGAIERTWRGLARRMPCVVVGAQLAGAYDRSPALHVLTVSLVRERDITEGPPARSESGLELLSVGRLDPEKNPLLLAELMERLREDGTPWTLRVCGDGPVRGALEGELRRRGVADAVRFEGYVPFGARLLDYYRHSDALVVPSLAGEGVPQTIVEALASGLPVVTTDVGGIKSAFGEHVSTVPVGDVPAIAVALRRLREDPSGRQQIADAGRNAVRPHTLEVEAGRLGGFLATAAAR